MRTGQLERWEGKPPEVWGVLWGVPTLEIWSRIGSTNDRARELAERGCAPFTTVLAEEQTAGRGRSGAPWYSPPGTGLWLTTVVPGGARRDDAHRTLLAGLAVAEAIEAEAEISPRIEWPNDVLVAGRKVSGVLCESVRGGVAVGVGVNVLTPPGGFPPELEEVATSLEMESGKSLSRAGLAGSILRGLRDRLRGAGGSLSVRDLEALRARDGLLGRRVRTEQGEGRVAGIADDGSLLVEREDGSRVGIRAGRVHPLQEGSAPGRG